MWNYNNTDELYHHGVKGQKWGVRRYQNKNGSLTPAGKKRYSLVENDNSPTKLETAKTALYKANKAYDKAFNKAHARSIAAYSPLKKHREANDKRWEDAANKAKEANKAKKEYISAKKKYKEIIKERANEIRAGENHLMRMWDTYTGSHKRQAKMEYDMGLLREKD